MAYNPNQVKLIFTHCTYIKCTLIIVELDKDRQTDRQTQTSTHIDTEIYPYQIYRRYIIDPQVEIGYCGLDGFWQAHFTHSNLIHSVTVIDPPASLALRFHQMPVCFLPRETHRSNQMSNPQFSLNLDHPQDFTTLVHKHTHGRKIVESIMYTHETPRCNAIDVCPNGVS